jgi:hypothetical protein
VHVAEKIVLSAEEEKREETDEVDEVVHSGGDVLFIGRHPCHGSATAKGCSHDRAATKPRLTAADREPRRMRCGGGRQAVVAGKSGRPGAVDEPARVEHSLPEAAQLTSALSEPVEERLIGRGWELSRRYVSALGTRTETGTGR